MSTPAQQDDAEGGRALQALAGFLPAFQHPDFKAGGFIRGEHGSEPGVISLGWIDYAPVVTDFVAAAYKDGWISPFDWPAWAQSDEARALRDNQAAMASATQEQLAKLLTVCIRQDRFCEGALLDAFESGLILRIVERAAALAKATPPGDG